MCELRHRASRSCRWPSMYWLGWEGLSVKRRGAQDGSSAAGLSLGDGLYRTPVRPEVSLAGPETDCGTRTGSFGTRGAPSPPWASRMKPHCDLAWGEGTKPFCLSCRSFICCDENF